MNIKVWRWLLKIIMIVTGWLGGCVHIRLGDFYYGGEMQRNPFYFTGCDQLEFAFGVVPKVVRHKAHSFDMSKKSDRREFLSTIEIMIYQKMQPAIEICSKKGLQV